MDTTVIELKLTVTQVNYILQALAQRPFGEVVDLIAAIKGQGDMAVQAAAQEAPKVDNPEA